ncbi:MAG: hypothetical protein AB1342_07340 [Pseudomonadota bacterium]
MAAAVDGYSIFKSIGKNPELFGSIHADVNKAATTLVAKQLAKSTVEQYREIYSAVGEDDFRKTIEAMKSVSTLLKRIDPHADLKTVTDREKRNHLVELAKGEVEPTVKPAKATKKKKPAPLMGLKSMKARPKKNILIDE